MKHSALTAEISPRELICLRFDALQAHNFLLLYASYHPQAPFIEQFLSAAAYIEYATQNLSGMSLGETHIGASRKTPQGVEIICALRFELGGQVQTLLELALLLPTDDGWRYHSAQKLSAEDYQGEFEALDFVHFDRQSPKIRF